MTELSLVRKSNFQKQVNPSIVKISEEKLNLFCHEGDKKSSSSMKDEAKTDKSENIVRKLFDVLFPCQKAEGTLCAPIRP